MHGGFHAVPGRLAGAVQASAGAGLQEPPGASRGLQGPPGASRGLQGPPGAEGPPKPQKTQHKSLEPWARLKFHAGWSGWTRPPTMAGGGGVYIFLWINTEVLA